MTRAKLELKKEQEIVRHIIEEKPSSKEQRPHNMKEYDMFKKPRKVIIAGEQRGE